MYFGFNIDANLNKVGYNNQLVVQWTGTVVQSIS